jgi:signal peptidase I
VIPAGEYFVLGDNRNRSTDSRSFGLVPRADIEARCLYRIRDGQTTWLYPAGSALSLR